MKKWEYQRQPGKRVLFQARGTSNWHREETSKTMSRDKDERILNLKKWLLVGEMTGKGDQQEKKNHNYVSASFQSQWLKEWCYHKSKFQSREKELVWGK